MSVLHQAFDAALFRGWHDFIAGPMFAEFRDVYFKPSGEQGLTGATFARASPTQCMITPPASSAEIFVRKHFSWEYPSWKTPLARGKRPTKLRLTAWRVGVFFSQSGCPAPRWGCSA
jgi:hypothetical protein